jgi:tetratricopeptide (TPR) repeat protein
MAEDAKLFSFAEFLYDSGDYYRAIGEYKRYIFYNPEGKFAENAAFKIGLSYLAAEKWDGAAEAFENAGDKYGGAMKKFSLLSEAYTYSCKQDYEYSDVLLSRFTSDFEKSPEIERANYLLAFNKIYEHKWEEARELFLQIKTAGKIMNSAQAEAVLLEKVGDIQTRNTVASVLFSAVIPGSGYYYCGRWADGFFSMIFNGFFIYNTYGAFSRNDSGLKLTYGIPALVFYLSSLYGSAIATDKFNNDEIKKFINSTEGSKIDVINYTF